MAGNKNLGAAKNAKKDEFYTQLVDIANELKHYRKHFEGKVVLCNCDDPYESNFFKFFASKFNSWGLKKLICTCYNGSSVAGTDLFFSDFQPERNAYKIELTEVKDLNGDGAIDLQDVKLLLEQNPPQLLRGNGDFRSSECIEFLKEADIVVTNPPFSLFRQYVAQLVEYDKKFLIIGHQNAIKYKEVFPHILEGKIWLGYGFKGGATHFYSNYVDTASAGDHKEGMIRVSGVVWFTNLEHSKRHEPMDLYKRFTPEEYPLYDNYDVIEVGKTSEIPIDYEGIMGVPITFLYKFCPEQFELLGCSQRGSHDKVPDKKKYDSYYEVERKTDKRTGSKGGKANENPILEGKGEKKHYFINDAGHIVHSEYDRLFIRKKQN